MKRQAVLLLTLISTASCHSYTCKDLPDAFPSGEAAIQRIKTSTFRFVDEFTLSDTSLAFTAEMLSWITRANYYSCDGKRGYLIYRLTRGSDHIRQNIPIELWKGLKDTSAKGPYYDRYIKDKYHGITVLLELSK
jgi:hypothetical protein